MFERIKNFFNPPTAELVFIKGDIVYFRTAGTATVGQKQRFTAELSQGQTFGALLSVLGYEADQNLYTARIEEPREAMEYLPKLLGLPFEDRRVRERHDLAVKVMSPHLQGYSGMTRNLSESGICLSTAKPYLQGMIVDLEMDLDSTGLPPLRVQIETCWCSVDDSGKGERQLLGGRFLAMTQSQRSQLRHCLKSY